MDPGRNSGSYCTQHLTVRYLQSRCKLFTARWDMNVNTGYARSLERKAKEIYIDRKIRKVNFRCTYKELLMNTTKAILYFVRSLSISLC